MKLFKYSLVSFTLLIILNTVSYSFTDFNSVEADKAKTLNIINGYEDNTFKPENSLKRGEAIKVFARGLNLDIDYEKTSDKTSKYKDVNDHWAKPYIIATDDSGLIKGVGDGNFLPEDTLSYNEAITICVRLLGLRRIADDMNEGWPENYINIADEIRITEVIDYEDGNDDITRGDMVKLLIETLETPYWENVEDSKVYEPQNKLLLEDKFDIILFDGVSIDEDLNVNFDEMIIKTDRNDLSNDNIKFDEDKNYEDYIGEYLTLWTDKEGNVKYIGVKNTD